MKPVPTQVHMPLAFGLDSKTHPFALDMPRLAKCENGIFSEPGSIQKRPGHTYLVAPGDIAVSLLTTGKGTSSDIFNTAVINPASGSVVTVLIESHGVAGTILPVVVSGCSLTWTQVAQVNHAGNMQLTLFKGTGTPSSGALTIAFDSAANTVIWRVHQYTNASTIRQAVTASGSSVASLSATLAAAGSTENVLGSGWAVRADVSVTPRAGWTEDGEEHQTSGTVGTLETQYILGTADLTGSATPATSQDMLGIVYEVQQSTFGLDINGGGTLTNIKGLAVRDDELICFAENSTTSGSMRLFSWSPAISKWVDKGAYEGAKPTVTPVAERKTNQTLIDQASYVSGSNRVVLRAWTDSGDSQVHAQVFDAATGLALSDDTAMGTQTTRPRCLLVGAKLFLFYADDATGAVKLRIVDPATPGTFGSANTIITTTVGTPYDVCRRNSDCLFVVRDNASGGYYIASMDSTGVGSLTGTTKTTYAAASGKYIAVCYEPNLNRVAVFRYAAALGALKADILNGGTFADIGGAVDKQLFAAGGSTESSMAVAFRETAEGDGTYRALCFSGKIDTAGTTTQVVKAAYIGTGGATGNITGPAGSAGIWMVGADPASRAFARGRFVYFYLTAYASDGSAPGATNQKVTLLYREDGLCLGRFFSWTAVQPSALHVPQVEEYSSDVFAAVLPVNARVLFDQVNAYVDYSDKGMKEVQMDFNSSLPYRAVQMGRTLYMYGGLLSQYDGSQVSEANFHKGLGSITSVNLAGAGGNLSAGKYYWRAYPEWPNAQGEMERGTYIVAFTTGADAVANDKATITLWNLPQTAKSNVALVITRTEANGSVFYRVTKMDPASGSGDNKYLTNDRSVASVTFVDNLSDANLRKAPPDYLNGGTADNLAPEGGQGMARGQGRLFLWGRDRNKVRYSKTWQPDEGIAFNEAFEILVPQDGGDITNVATSDSAVVIWKESRIYYCEGTGFDNAGTGSNYTEPRLLSADTGAVADAPIILGPEGWYFVSPKGIRLLDRSLNVVDVGSLVDDYKTQTFTAGLLLEDQNLVLFITSSGSTLVYDYFVKQWSTWTNPVGAAAVLWNGGYVYCTSSGIFKSTTEKTDAGVSYNCTVKSPHVFHFGRTGYGMVWELEILGEYVAPHKARVKLYLDGESSPTYSQAWTVDSTKYIVRVRPTRKKLRSIQVEFSDESDGTNPLADSFKLVALSFLVGVEQSLSKHPSSRSM